jgi:hypothetical protein
VPYTVPPARFQGPSPRVAEAVAIATSRHRAGADNVASLLATAVRKIRYELDDLADVERRLSALAEDTADFHTIEGAVSALIEQERADITAIADRLFGIVREIEIAKS